MSIQNFRPSAAGLIFILSLLCPHFLFGQKIQFKDVTSLYQMPGNTVNNVSAYGHGVIMADINGDQRPDIYISNAVRYADELAETMYVSTTSGYQENDQARGVEDKYGWTGSHGIIFFDYDNDGDYDIVNATTDDRNRLYKNSGDGFYQDVTDAARLPLYRFVFPDFDSEAYGYGTRGVTAFDANNDGFMDLLAVNWGPAESRYDENTRIVIPPQPNEFYLNNGDGSFRTVTNSGLTHPPNHSYMGTQGVTAADVDNDGDMDVLIVHRNYTALTEDGRSINGFNPEQQIPNQLMINDGHGHFTDETSARGLFDARNDANGATFADYDNDGDLDLFVPPKDKTRTFIRIYRNRGNGYFDDVTSALGIRQWGFSTFFLDADNDGDLDIIAPKTRDYTTFYRNNGDGTFSEQSGVGVEIRAYDPRGGAIGDIDDDGDVDFYYADANKFIDPLYSNRLFRNDLKSSNRWIKITGRGPGGDIGGFGSKIWLFDKDHIEDPDYLVGYRQVINSYGYLCQDDPEQHFGIGQRDTVDVKVKLLDGTELFMLKSPANSRLFFKKPSQIVKVSGDGQSVPIGSLTPQPLVVRILAKDGSPVHGARVTFQSDDTSARFLPSDVVHTDKEGYISVHYRLGLSALQIVTVSCMSIPDETLHFTITGTGTNIGSIDIVSGDDQKGQAGYTLDLPLVVLLKDNNSKPLANAAIHFQVIEGGGLVNKDSFYEVLTNSEGKAHVDWTLGLQVSARQRVDAYPMARPTLITTFTATAFGPPTKLAWVSPLHFEGVVNTNLPDSLAAQITDADGHPIRGVPVTFDMTQGGGLVNGESKVTIPTQSNGLAKIKWKLGQKAGVDNQSVTVSSAGMQGSPIIVTATARAGHAYLLTKISGDNQIGDKNSVLPEPLVLAVQDSFANPVSQQPVQFSIIKGDGSFDGQPTISLSTEVTGKVNAFFTLGQADTSRVQANSFYLGKALVASPQIFTAIGQDNTPQRLKKIDGDAQTGLINKPLSKPFRVLVLSASGNPISNFPVEFRADSSAASFDGKTAITNMTDKDGYATATATLGSLVGQDVYHFDVFALYEDQHLHDSPLSFVASGIWTAATKMELLSESEMSGLVGTVLNDSVRVRIYDAKDQPVANQPVVFDILSGSSRLDGMLSSATKKSDAGGDAAVAVQLGTTSDTTVLQIEANNGIQTLAPGFFKVRIISRVGPPDTAASLFTAPTTLLADGTTVGDLEVQLLDAYGNPIPQQTVEFFASGLQVHLNQPDSPTNRQGRTVGSFTSAMVGQVTIAAMVNNRTFLSVIVDCLPGPATRAYAFGDRQRHNPEQLLPQPIGVLVTDAWSHPLAGEKAHFTIIDGGGDIIDAQPVKTDVTGRAFAHWRLGPIVGEQHARAQIAEMDTTILFTAFAQQQGEAQVSIVSGDLQIVQVGKVVRDSLIVELVDKAGHPLPNEIITFSVVGGAGPENGTIITDVQQKTDQHGRARALYQAGDKTGLQHVRAESFQWGSAEFTLWVESERIFTLLKTSQDGQTARPLETIRCALLMLDAFARPVPNERLVATVEKGGGSVAIDSTITSPTGEASFDWSLGVSGQQALEVKPVDGFGALVYTAFVDNMPPVFIQPSPLIHFINIPIGEEVLLTIEAQDSDFDSVSYSAYDLPEGASFSGTLYKQFAWKPAEDQTGAYDIILIASDFYGAADSLSLHIDVTEQPDYFAIRQRQPETTTLDVPYDDTVLFAIDLNEPADSRARILWYHESRRLVEGPRCPIHFTVASFPIPELRIFANIIKENRLMPLRWTVLLHKKTYVELTELIASFKENAVELSWQTSTESDIRGFIVERTSDKEEEPKKQVADLITPQQSKRYNVIDRDVLCGVNYTYQLLASGTSDQVKIGSVDISIPLPVTIVLAQNYPNPFNPNTTIRYILPKAQFVEILLYDVNGKKVRCLTSAWQEAGEYTVVWDGRDNSALQVPSGVYLYRLAGENETVTKKLMLLK
ncbi:Ig-like domain-containing protein [candidate division KSB1 bacterium]|nr:Ig-like domain-containing protein [candidate division KSB1 bacterium]